MKLNQEITYLTARLERNIESEKRIEEDLSRVEESATHSTYKLGLGFERIEKEGEQSHEVKFVPSSTNKDEEESLKI